MLMKNICYALALCMLQGSALAKDNCETELFKSGTQLLVTDHPEKNRFLSLVIQNADGKRIRCADQPRTEDAQIRRLSKSIGRSSPLTITELISLSAASWTQMARGASQQIAKRSYKSPNEFDAIHVDGIERLILEESPSSSVASNLMRTLARLNTPAAREVLIRVLRRSANTAYQVTAARMLVQIRSPETRAALELCSGLNNPMVSAQCKRSLIRYQVRAEAEITPQ